MHMGNTQVTENVDSLISSAMNHVVEKHSMSGTKIGWLMMASVFIEAWDLYSISFVLVFIKQIYNPSAWLLGLASAGTQGGAALGCLLGGWLTDKVGRRPVFFTTMIMFVVFGFAQAFAPNVLTLAIIRIFLGLPLGADIANGFTYVMEYVQSGKREVMGNRWQFIFAAGEICAILVTLIFIGSGLHSDLVWRIILGLSGVPAVILFILRFNLPETVIWLIQHGKFVQAKQVATEMYNDSLDMLPNEDQKIPKVRLGMFLKEIHSDTFRFRSSFFGWLSGFCQNAEFTTFAFYIPLLLVALKVSGIFKTDLITLFLYIIALISGMVGPMITPKIGQRKLSIVGFGMTFVSLVLVGIALLTNHPILVPFIAAIFLWGHYWDAENGMSIASAVAPAKYRGMASGFSYFWTKISGFIGLTIFPVVFSAVGNGGATLIVSLFALCGLLAAIFLLPEVYGYKKESL